MPKSHQIVPYREQWLEEAKRHLEEVYFRVPTRRFSGKVNVSVGLPFGSLKAIGQCWDKSVSKDGSTNIFICPSLDDPITVLATLAHELVHAVVGNAAKHGPEFKRVALQIGLRGKMQATVPGDEMIEQLAKISDSIGPYPHSAMKKSKAGTKKPRKKSIILVSPSDPDYQIRISEDIATAYERYIPTDPWGDLMVPKDEVK